MSIFSVEKAFPKYRCDSTFLCYTDHKDDHLFRVGSHRGKGAKIRINMDRRGISFIIVGVTEEK